MTQDLILEIISDITLGILFPLFYSSVLNSRVKKWIYIIPVATLFSVLGVILYLLKIPQFIVFITGISINLLTVIIVFKDEPIKKLLYTFIPYAADIMVSLIYLSLRTILMPGWQSNFGSREFMDTLELAILLLGNIFALFIISMVIRRKKPKVNELTGIYLLSIIIIQMFFLTFLMYVYYTEVRFTLFICAVGVYMILSAAIALAIIRYTIRLSREQSRQELTLNQYGLMTAQYSQLRNSYMSYKKLRHDLKEHINVINGLALKGKTDDLKEYTSSLNRSWESLSSKTFCDVPAVDVVIADKFNIALSEDIKTDFIVSGIKEAAVDYIYLCSIISNLLNNAIEAAAFCKNDRYVIFHCGIVMDNLVITCRNSYSENNHKKPDPQDHGYGLHIIKDFAGLLGGNFVHEHDENKFTAIVTIPIRAQEKKQND